MKGRLAPLMTSRSAEWRTPVELFNTLHHRYRFTLDAAASRLNTMLPKFYTRRTDGLAQSWAGERVWCNPPYSRNITGLWTTKAAESGTFVVMLLPARTDTAWWHDDVLSRAQQIAYVRGRLRFEGATAGAPFPSAIVVYDPSQPVAPPVAIDQRGNLLRVVEPPGRKTATA